MTDTPRDPASEAAYFASIWGLSSARLQKLEAAFRSFAAPPAPTAGREQALEVVLDVASTTAQAHRNEGRTVLADQIDTAIRALKDTTP